MERWVAKVLALLGSFFLPLICTVLPHKVSGCIARRGDAGKRILSYLMCLGGGIFFGTYLLHMGPEVQKILHDSLLEPYGISYPVAELVAGIGFFIVLFAEKLVLRWNKNRIRRKRRSSCRSLKSTTTSRIVTTPGDVEDDGLIKFPFDRSRCARPPSMGMCEECIVGKPCSGFDESGKPKDLHLVETLNAALGAGKNDSTAGDHTSELDLLGQRAVSIEDLAVCASAITDGTSCPMSGTGECCVDPPLTDADWSQKEKHLIITMKVDENATKVLAKPEEEEVDHDEPVGGHHHATRSIILILALSLHRIFEGMSIGLQASVANVAGLFLAVMCHEMVIGFSLGLQFVKSGFKVRRLVITSLVCSSIMPVGVLGGLIMTEVGTQGSAIDIANGLLQALAMGTFIYVTFFEILQEEVDPEDTSIGKIVFIALGFALMALLDLIPEEQPVEAVHLYLSNSTTLSTN